MGFALGVSQALAAAVVDIATDAVQAGAVPVTWQQVLLEWQRDWARKETYDSVMALVKEHSGAYGMGVDYAYTMVHKAPERVKHGERIGPNPAK
jgi:nicotinamidase-related amidase